VLTRPLRGVAIPDTLQDSLMARLDQMHTAKEVAQLGAVLGREQRGILAASTRGCACWWMPWRRSRRADRATC
jgi:hypothetical protein